jgi:Tol biopolymer transport system component
MVRHIRSRAFALIAAAALSACLLVLTAAGEPLQAAPGAKDKIAFASARADNNTNFDIWVMNDDGTNPLRLTNDPLPEFQPAYSPDGTKIAFTRGGSTNREIYVMNADGSGERDLTNDPAGNPAFDFDPDWSPDGTQLAFDSDRGGVPCAALYTISPNCTDIRKLTADVLEAFGAAWSPEGDKFAFSDHACSGESDLFVMKTNGKGAPTQLFETSDNEAGATWSPDGERIAFERIKFVNDRFVFGTGEIYVVGEKGKSQTNLTNYPDADDIHPDWSPK